MDRGTASSGETSAAVGRPDRSLLALLEVGAAVILVWSQFVPWFVIHGPNYTTWLSAGGYSPDGLLTQDLLIPFAAAVAVVVTVAGLAFPARGAKIAVLMAFAAAVYGAGMQFQEVLSADNYPYPLPPTAAWGLWLFTATAVVGGVLAIVDIVRGGSSTFLWRAINRPSMRRYGMPAAYVVMLLITLPIVLFPMFPNWWFYLWLAALAALPVLVVRARKTGRPAGEPVVR
jgi:hypothetical protein